MTRTRLLVIGALWLVLALLLGVTGARPSAVALLGAVCAIATVVLVTLDLSRGVQTVTWTRRSRRPGVRQGSDRRAVGLRRQMTSARWLTSTELRDTLVSLVDDRLVAHHRIDRQAAPAAARAVLTPSLQRLVDAPRDERTGLRELRRVVADIEAL